MSSFAATQTTRKATPYECEDLLTNKDWWTDYDAVTWPNPDDDYVYTQGVRDTKCGAKAFGGRTFQLGIVGGAAGSLWGKGVNLSFLNEGLVLANGFLDQWENKEVWFSGKVTLTAPDTAPFLIFGSSDGSSCGYAFSGKFEGAENTRLCTQIYNTRKKMEHKGASLRLSGDLSGFYGTVQIGDNSLSLTLGDNTSSRTCPGQIVMGKNTRLILPYTVSKLNIARISFAEGSILHVRTGHDDAGPLCSTMTVTESLTLPSTGKLKIEMNETLPFINKDMEAPKYEVLKIAKSVREISLNDFELDPANATSIEGNRFLPKNAKLVLDIDENDVQTLSIQPRPITSLEKSDASGQSAFLPAFASHWKGMSDGDLLSPTTDYYVPNNQVRAPESSTNPNDWIFKGGSLTFDGGILILKGRPATVVSNLFMRAGTSIENWGSGVESAEYPNGLCTLDGTLTTVYKTSLGAWESIAFKAEENRGILVKSKICGRTNIQFNSDTQNKGKKEKGDATGYTPRFALEGDNSNFGAVMILATDPYYAECSPILKIVDGKNLGGPMYNGVYCPYAMWVRNGTCLRAARSLKLAEPTRGIYAHGGTGVARFSADAGVTFVIDGSPLSLNGCLRKEGSGTLALGGTLKFLDDDNKEVSNPETGRNLIHVAEGRLCALSTGAFAKAKISFGATGALSVKTLTGGEDADFAKYGALLTANDAPFDATTVPVTVEGDAAAFGEGVEVPVFTVTKTAAAGLSVTGVKPAKGYRIAVEMRENAGENTVTCWATVSHTGMVLLLR